MHFLCECHKYDTLRMKMFGIIDRIDFVRGIDIKNTFIKLMTSSDMNIIKAVATFIHDCEIS